jgi:hypothetical protein
MSTQRAPELHPWLASQEPSLATRREHLFHSLRRKISELREVIRTFEDHPSGGILRKPEHGDQHYSATDALEAAEQGKYAKALNLILNYGARPV